MTCIAAKIARGKLVMAADSALTGEGEVIPCGDKLWRINDFLLLGFAGDWGNVSKIKYSLAHTQQYKNFYPGAREVDRWVYTNIVERIRSLLTDYKKPEFSLLVGTRAGLFGTNESYGLFRYETYGAIGSGAQAANGAMFADSGAELAVRAAIKHSEGVLGKVYAESIVCPEK
jgi:ATP-dependent protease HslVU (ClpYQ) peptidase subunit